MHVKIKTLAIAAITALIPAAAQAIPILDQEHNSASRNGTVIEDRITGQFFTVGRDGLLDRVELDLRRQDTQSTSILTMRLRKITDGAAGDVLRTTTLSSAEAPSPAFGFMSFDFLDLDVDIGDMFLIELVADQVSSGVVWELDGDSAATYAGGTGFFNGNPIPRADYGFRTCVDDDIAVVPEPATLALFGTALVGIAMRRRKTRA
jgi:hypothetical protein